MGDINPQATHFTNSMCTGTGCLYMPPEAVQDKPVYAEKINWLLIRGHHSPDFDTTVSQSWRSITGDRIRPSRITSWNSMCACTRSQPSTKPHQ